MATNDATTLGQVSDGLRVDFNPVDKDPAGSWITKPVPDSIDEKIGDAPMGAMYELVYSVLARRLRDVLSSDQAHSDLISQFVHTAVNFRSINKSFFSGGSRAPTAPPNSGAGAGHYHSSVWGTNKDERLPYTLPLPNQTDPYSPGADVHSTNNRGLLVAKLFSDLESHLPLVLFNVVSKTYVPMGIGGSSTTRRIFQNGQVVTELGYKVILSVEATAVTEDDESTSNLQAIIEAAFGTLRDQVGTGASVTGKSWQIMLPTNLTPSTITETEAPWSQGDDKGGKIYTASVGMENVTFECYNYVARPVLPGIIPPEVTDGLPSITTSSTDDPNTTLSLSVGNNQRLIVSNLPLTGSIVVSQSRKIISLRNPRDTGGFYEVVPIRTGEATIYIYDTGMTQPLATSDNPSSRAGAPIYTRKVIVSPV